MTEMIKPGVMLRLQSWDILYIYEFVSWDDEIPNWMESQNPFMFQITNQLL